ncbi:MAG: tetratricopeptide repeat protein [Pseudomonadota bacterium]
MMVGYSKTCWTLANAAILSLALSACGGSDSVSLSAEDALPQGAVARADAAQASGLRRAPNDPASILEMAEGELAKGNLTNASRLFDMADKNAGRTIPRSLQGRGLIALRLGRSDRAVRLLTDALDEDPGLWRSRIGVARAHLAAGERSTAMVALAQIEAEAALSAPLLNDIGMVYLSDNAPKQALEYFARALRRDASHSAARSNIRIARAMLGEYDAAISGVSPEDAADALNNAGYAAILNGAYETADKLLRRALEVSPIYHAAARANLELLNQATAGATAREFAERAVRGGAPSLARSSQRDRAPETTQIAFDREQVGRVPKNATPVAEDPETPIEDTYRWDNERPADALKARPAPAQEVQTIEAASLSGDGYRWVR